MWTWSCMYSTIMHAMWTVGRGMLHTAVGILPHHQWINCDVVTQWIMSANSVNTQKSLAIIEHVCTAGGQQFAYCNMIVQYTSVR